MDPTESARAALQQQINAEAGSRAELLLTHVDVWNTEEMKQLFEVKGFAAPFVVVMRKSDGKRGTLCFQHNPRFYFDWMED